MVHETRRCVQSVAPLPSTISFTVQSSRLSSPNMKLSIVPLSFRCHLLHRAVVPGILGYRHSQHRNPAVSMASAVKWPPFVPYRTITVWAKAYLPAAPPL